jgi:sortase A
MSSRMNSRRSLLTHALAIALSLTALAWFGLDRLDGAAADGKARAVRPPAAAASPHRAARRTSTSTTVTRPAPTPTTTTTTTTTTTVPAPRAAPAPPPAPLPLPMSGVLPTPIPPPDPYAPEPVVQIATLRIPRIGLTAPLYEGVSLTVINHGPGHWPGTAVPGTWGNTVVAGHRTTYTEPFLNIDALAPGDPIIFELPDGTEATYATTGTEVVPPDALWIVNQTPGNTVTLFSCHPKGSAAQRLVVHGTLVSLRKH